MRGKLITGWILALLVQSLQAQEIMTLDRAIAEGLNANWGIQIARNDLQIARNDASPGNAGFLPSVDVSGAYIYSLSDASVEMITGQQLENSRASGDLITGGINLNWTLFDGCNMFIRYDKLKTMEEMGSLELKIAVENTTAAITVAFYNIIRQAAETGILREQVEISTYRLELAQTMYETGSGSEMEWLKARVERNADLAALADQQTRYTNSKTYLNQLLARDINTPFEVTDSIVLADTLVYDSVQRNMITSNHELLLAGKEMETAALDIKSARAQQFPEIDFLAGLNYYRNESEASMMKYNRQFGPSVGVTARIDLFDGLNLNRLKKDARITYLNREFERKRLELKLEAWLTRVYNEYMNQLQLVGFETENLTLATRNMDIAMESYSVGAISSLQLREIQKNLLDARVRLLTARFETKTRETELLLLTGKLAIE
ncbi:MAG: TolC family protein [Bacteroidales bacterium]|nr:TolC family protein [Bacteroidales bacterium]